jgi:hypothetical protein
MSARCIRKAAPLQHRGEAGARRKSALSGIQQGEPLNGASVRFRFGLPEGWTVKLSGPFEVEVLRAVSNVKRSVSPWCAWGRLKSETEVVRWGD